MPRKMVVTVAFTLSASLMLMLFIFMETPAMTNDSLMAAYKSTNQYYATPVSVNDVIKLAEKYTQSILSNESVNSSNSTAEVVPSVPAVAGSSNVTSLIAGRYYYHQSDRTSCNCGSHGVWSTSTWGSSYKQSKFASNGCAVYSLSMAVSNLLKKEVNPDSMLKILGCTYSNGHYSTDNTPNFSGVSIYRQRAINTVCNAYGLRSTEVKNASEASLALSKGAVLWCIVKGSVWNSTANTHFVSIYAQNNSYYSAYDSSDLNYLNSQEPVSAFWDSHVHGPVFAIYR